MCAGTVPVVVSGLVCSLLVLAVRDERRRMHAVTVVRQPAQDGRSSCVTARTSRAHTNQQTIPEAQCLCTYHGHLPRELTPGTSRQQREFDGSWHPLAGSEAARLASIEALEKDLVRSRPKLVASQSFFHFHVLILVHSAPV